MATLIDPSKYDNPFDVPDKVMDGVNKILTVKEARDEFNISESTWENSFTFLFSRNPYTRIYSAFVDKLVAPDPYFWTELGAKASVARNSNGHNVTFAEFVRYIIKCLEKDTNIDAHFVPIFDKCSPCEVKYKYIGKLEQFSEDAKYVFESIGQYSLAKRFSPFKVTSSLAESAALNQTISVPYVSRNTIRNKISWKTALKRIWLKLQLRGLVAFDKKIEDFVSSTEFDSISADELIKRANKAKSLSDWTVLKQQKHDAMREAYMTLHINDVNMLRNLYKNDFKIFGYDDRPDNLFKRQPEPIGETKYLDYYKWV